MSHPLSLLRLLAIPTLIMANVQFLFGILSVILFKDQTATQFFIPASGFAIIALTILLITHNQKIPEISYRHSLLYVTLTWIICCLEASLPIKLIQNISITDAVFESMSALTTTGATVLVNLDVQPHSFLMYRQLLQWLGGMGVVVFVVAIVPMLNIGGMKIFRMETPGPAKDDKLAPRIQHTARHLWIIYLVITLLCALSYYVAGMTLFDAVAHSFTTVSTGGFSTHDASLGYFNSHLIECVSVVFMILGAISFALHYRFARTHDLSIYFRDEEAKDFLLTIIVLMLVLSGILAVHHSYTDYSENMVESLFHLVSFITSTGYGAGDFTHWPVIATVLLVFSGYIGGCAGSTAGGNKMIRNIISVKLIGRQIKQLVHPRGMFVVKYKQKTVKEDVSSATISYMIAAAMLTMVFCVLLQATGLDFWTAFTAVAACLNVLGPAFGELGNNFQPVSDFGTWLLTFTMLLGRLEFYSVLVLLTPMYWKY